MRLTTKVTPKDLKRVEKDKAILVVESEDYSDSEIKAIKAKGYKLVAYLSIGTISSERTWFKKYCQYKLKRLEDWPKEYYMDMRKSPWQKFLASRARHLKRRGFDGWWLDNLDVYEYYKSKGMFKSCAAVLKAIKGLGGYVMVNGGSDFFDDAMDRKVDLRKYVDGVTQEEVFSRITNYYGKGKFGKQKLAQSKWYQRYMKRLKKFKVHTFLLEYTRDDKVKKKIKNFCAKYKMTGYYISSDVNL